MGVENSEFTLIGIMEWVNFVYDDFCFLFTISAIYLHKKLSTRMLSKAEDAEGEMLAIAKVVL